ncbi:hypothetical protein [Streptomyces sp. NPDC050560]|uniref:hypothetical protein n=1 Tax=Streptomyces sp. NPDC050560 TaxID=3365630 RepID=UPI00379AB0DC
MAIADDLRKTFTDPTPLYFAAGTADLAYQQAKRVPGLVEQFRSEAPARLDAVRNTDPKEVQGLAVTRAKEVQETLQTKVAELVGAFDTDLKKLGESAQDLALRSVGVAAEYAVRARETYEKVAEHGEQTVRTWRGEAADQIVEAAGTVEPEPVVVKDETPVAQPPVEQEAPAKPAAKPAAKKTTARKTAAKPAAKKPRPAAE